MRNGIRLTSGHRLGNAFYPSVFDRGKDSRHARVVRMHKERLRAATLGVAFADSSAVPFVASESLGRKAFACLLVPHSLCVQPLKGSPPLGVQFDRLHDRAQG
ncbi:hypothetical protein D3C85_1533710 [compost metagenome]